VQRFALPILIGLAAVGALLLFIVPPIAQPQWYHDFADQRLLLGIPNFWNVICNLPFLIVGGRGVSMSCRLDPDNAEQTVTITRPVSRI
jgi:hypothetical protein